MTIYFKYICVCLDATLFADHTRYLTMHTCTQPSQRSQLKKKSFYLILYPSVFMQLLANKVQFNHLTLCVCVCVCVTDLVSSRPWRVWPVTLISLMYWQLVVVMAPCASRTCANPDSLCNCLKPTQLKVSDGRLMSLQGC